jgi:hypothetical protein
MARRATKVDEKPARGEDAANGIGRGGRFFNRAVSATSPENG